MSKRTSKERDRDFERGQIHHFYQFKQTISSPDFRAAWGELERLAKEKQEAESKVKKLSGEIHKHEQAQEMYSAGGEPKAKELTRAA